MGFSFSIFNCSLIIEKKEKLLSKTETKTEHKLNDENKPLTPPSPVPIKPATTSLCLPLHQIDTFTRWTPPINANLIITVSFGLLVPARILSSATYGGLNLHPSLLPDLRGPAPLHHALLRRRSHTGVSLQTMHPTKFDHGVVLMQSEEPGVEIDSQRETVGSLLERLGEEGARMLVRGIEEGVFVEPLRDVREGKTIEEKGLVHAPKLSAADRGLDLEAWDAEEVVLRDRVLERLWRGKGEVTVMVCGPSVVNGGDVVGPHSADFEIPRAAFTGPWRIEEWSAPEEVKAGMLIVYENSSSQQSGEKVWRVGFATKDGKVVSPAGITLDGGKKEEGMKALIQMMEKKKPGLLASLQSGPLDAAVQR